MQQFDNNGNVVNESLGPIEKNKSLVGASGKGTSFNASEVIPFILQEMSKIREDKTLIEEAMSQLSFLETSNNTSGQLDVGTKAKAEAISNIVSSREATHKRMLEIYQTIINSTVTGQSKDSSVEKLQTLAGLASHFANNEDFASSFGDQFGEIFVAAMKN